MPTYTAAEGWRPRVPPRWSLAQGLPAGFSTTLLEPLVLRYRFFVPRIEQRVLLVCASPFFKLAEHGRYAFLVRRFSFSRGAQPSHERTERSSPIFSAFAAASPLDQRKWHPPRTEHGNRQRQRGWHLLPSRPASSLRFAGGRYADTAHCRYQEHAHASAIVRPGGARGTVRRPGRVRHRCQDGPREAIAARA